MNRCFSVVEWKLLYLYMNMLIIIRTELSNNKIDLYSTIERFHHG